MYLETIKNNYKNFAQGSLSYLLSSLSYHLHGLFRRHMMFLRNKVTNLI